MAVFSVTSNLSMAKGLNSTEWAGASSGLPCALPMIKLPPGSKTISTPDLLWNGLGAEAGVARLGAALGEGEAEV